MPEESKKTPLNQWHKSNGAKMGTFGGYDIPLWYSSGIKTEHLAVLTRAGLFDTSHMAGVMVSGPGALDLLQWLFTKDLSRCLGMKTAPLVPGRCAYGAFLDENGYVVDDSIIFQLNDYIYMVYVNAGMGKTIARHFETYGKERDVEIKNMTDQIGKVDLQGPMAAKVLKQIVKGGDTILKDLIYFKFKGHFDVDIDIREPVFFNDGTPVLISRTGYTGEFGFEVFVPPEKLVGIWENILDAGKSFDVIPCGLAARDSLRAGAVLPLSHQDIGDWPYINHPWTFALPYDDDQMGFTKRFLGDQSLLNVKHPEFTYPFAGFDLRKVSGGQKASVFEPEQKTPLGTVLTCVTDMGIGRYKNRIYSIAASNIPDDFEPKGLSCGFVKVSKQLKPGQILELRDRRRIKVEVVDDIRPDRTARKPIKQML
ncbi:MAG: aminomethyltransferase family protein [Desulfobacterales bacterium]